MEVCQGDDYIETWIGRQNMGFSDMAVTKFKQIKKYCDDNGIELICVTSPITPGVMKTLGMEKVDGLFTSFFEEQNVTYYNLIKQDWIFLQEKILTMATKRVIWAVSLQKGIQRCLQKC